MKDDTAPAVVAEAVKATPKKASKLKAVEPKTAEPSKPKIIIYGKPGVKKTWVSLDFPATYYVDTEGGADLTAYTDKLKKSGGMYYGPDQGSQNFEDVIDQVKALATEAHQFKTLVIDSKSKIFNIEIANEMERLGDKDAFGASKKPAVQKTRRLMNWLDRLDMTVILICHEKPVWANDKQVGVTFDGYDKLEYELHLCLNIQKIGTESKAFVKKSRLPGFPDASSFNWSYEEFAARYGREVLESMAKTTVLASPEQVKQLKSLIEIVKLPEGQEKKWLDAAKAESYGDMEATKVVAIIDYIKNTYINKGEAA